MPIPFLRFCAEPLTLTFFIHACRGDLLSALLQLDKEDDVNKVLRYFSYEHFYVIYCKVQNAALRSEHLAACVLCRGQVCALILLTC